MTRARHVLMTMTPRETGSFRVQQRCQRVHAVRGNGRLVMVSELPERAVEIVPFFDGVVLL